MQRLTLCLIARDEERMLPGCLASVRGLADAIVVVDTGSRDRTVELAEAAGARVVPFEWRDDFAAARNAALEAVSSGFVLVLDADERLGPGARRAVRKALRRDDFDCGLLTLHDAASLEASPEDVVSGAARRGEPVLLARLLRRTPDLAWEGVVHEQVSSWLARGRRVARVEAPIVHYGAVPSLREARHKGERNLRLLEKRCALEPGDATAHAYRCRELVRAGRQDEAREAADAAWNALASEAAQGQPRRDVVLPATLRAFLLLQSGRLDEAERTLDQAREWSVAHPNIDLLTGLAHERRALAAGDVDHLDRELAAAEAAYGRCLEQGGQTFASETMPGATGWAAATRLGTVRVLAGRPAEALEAFERALAASPEHLEARLGRLEALIDAGQAASALRELPALLSPGTPDAWLLAASAAGSVGRADECARFAEVARAALDRQPWVGSHRAARLAALKG